jgi:hypothetical protein
MPQSCECDGVQGPGLAILDIHGRHDAVLQSQDGRHRHVWTTNRWSSSDPGAQGWACAWRDVQKSSLPCFVNASRWYAVLRLALVMQAAPPPSAAHGWSHHPHYVTTSRSRELNLEIAFRGGSHCWAAV